MSLVVVIVIFFFNCCDWFEVVSERCVVELVMVCVCLSSLMFVLVSCVE